MSYHALCWVCQRYHRRLTALVQTTDGNGTRVEYCPVCDPELARLYTASRPERVALLHRQHPDWTAARIALAVGLSPRRVCQLLAAARIPLRRGPLPMPRKNAA